MRDNGRSFLQSDYRKLSNDYIGKYFYAEFCTGWIRRFDPATSTSVHLPLELPTRRSYVTADGSLYYLARGRRRVSGSLQWTDNHFGEVKGR